MAAARLLPTSATIWGCAVAVAPQCVGARQLQPCACSALPCTVQNIKTYITTKLHACKAPLQLVCSLPDSGLKLARLWTAACQTLECSLPDSGREGCRSGAESAPLRSSFAPAQRAAAQQQTARLQGGCRPLSRPRLRQRRQGRSRAAAPSCDQRAAGSGRGAVLALLHLVLAPVHLVAAQRQAAQPQHRRRRARHRQRRLRRQRRRGGRLAAQRVRLCLRGRWPRWLCSAEARCQAEQAGLPTNLHGGTRLLAQRSLCWHGRSCQPEEQAHAQGAKPARKPGPAAARDPGRRGPEQRRRAARLHIAQHARGLAQQRGQGQDAMDWRP